MKIGRLWIASAALSAALLACDDDEASVTLDGGAAGEADAAGEAAITAMEGDTAACEFDTLIFEIDGARRPISINGLPVEALSGAAKSGPDTVEVVQRRGVRFSVIFQAAGLELADETPVNCVARDGWDPLRTRLEGDVSKLPTVGFLKAHGYVYVGSPGDKDPLYPEMEGRSLAVDYDLTGDEEVPEYLGGALRTLSFFRWQMIEYIDENQAGLFEFNPVI
ncbi:hypothetical protein KKF91_11915 [Myxococcota bacterium]|nr:hypothetical protein [Myxococcota bacterium]MBU1897326.1 hypothetical protein [Myxococcota bacterium]